MVIQPSIDAFSPKNQDMDDATAQAILGHVGLLGAGVPQDVTATFTRYDGSPGRVDRRCDIITTGPPPAADTPLVTQVSRWDRLKDPVGVMLGFAEHACDGTEAHLVLAGPNVSGVTDDPEGAAVFDEVTEAWRTLPHERRARVQLACLPMADIDENAAIVNALQRHSAIVVQKSIQEGFGLTVAEAMWKSRAVVATAVGGIRDQVTDGETGVLLDDPRDLRRFGEAVRALLDDPVRRERLGRNAREHVRRNFLVNRHARQYFELLGSGTGGAGTGRQIARSAGSGPGGAASWTRTRASTTMAPSRDTITGLQSISAISGWFSTRAPTRSTTSSSAPTSAFGAPRNPSRSANVFSDLIISRASRSVSGEIRTATSFSSSAWTPPAPQATTGPNSGSWTTPTSISTPVGTICWTRKPLGGCPASLTRRAICSAAAVVAAPPSSESSTPPASVLWRSVGAIALSATFPPNCAAALPASSAVSTTCDSGCGMP